MQTTTSIFEFASLGAYLNRYVAERKAVDPHYSYRKLAKEVGIKSASLLSMIARSKRAPSETVLLRLSTTLGWRPKELQYARILISMLICSSRERPKLVERLNEIRLTESGRLLTDSSLRWQDVAVMEMTDLGDFEDDPIYIERRTAGLITAAVARETLTKLFDAGLLERQDDGRVVRSAHRFCSRDGVPCAELRTFHKEMMRLASASLDEQPIDKRLASGTTLTIRIDALPEVQRLVEEFTTRLITLTHVTSGDATYHFAVQFFPIAAGGVPAPSTTPRQKKLV